MRGGSFRGGLHVFVIRSGGRCVFPRLVACMHNDASAQRDLADGIARLVVLVGGGLPVGSSSLFVGPSGIGKSTVAVQFAVAAAARGERAALFCFDETLGMLRTRCRKLGLPLERYLQSGVITAQQVDPAELS